MFVGDLAIDGRLLGPGHPCLIVAEVAQAHDGSLGTAHAYIDAVAKAGADAIKFQTHIAAAESTPGESFRQILTPRRYALCILAAYGVHRRTVARSRCTCAGMWFDLSFHAVLF
jgi:hypothetical protein